MPAFALDGALAVVMGGGSGSGRATTLALARSGVRVVVADLDKARALDAADAVRQTGADALGLECDVACEADLERLRAAALERFGQIHLLMNNVGVLPSGRFEDIPFKEWQRAVDVNLPSMVRSVQLFLPSLRSAGRAHIVNTASTAGLYAYAVDRLPYAVTKAAVVTFSEGLALYLRPAGIGVTCLCPGPVATRMSEQIRYHGPSGTVRPPALPKLDVRWWCRQCATTGSSCQRMPKCTTFCGSARPIRKVSCSDRSTA